VNGNAVEIFFSDSSFAPNVQILKTEEIYEIHAKILKPKPGVGTWPDFSVGCGVGF
jgi:hypothetical protein